MFLLLCYYYNVFIIMYPIYFINRGKCQPYSDKNVKFEKTQSSYRHFIKSII